MGHTDVLLSSDEPWLSAHVYRWRTRSTLEQRVFHDHGGLFLQRSSPWVGRWALNSAPLGKLGWLESLSRGQSCGEQAWSLDPFIHPTKREEGSTLGFNTRWQPSTPPTFHRRAARLTWRKVPLQQGCAHVCVCVCVRLLTCTPPLTVFHVTIMISVPLTSHVFMQQTRVSRDTSEGSGLSLP